MKKNDNTQNKNRNERFCKAFQQEGTPQVVQTWKKGVPADS
jgi:hypothetical protein